MDVDPFRLPAQFSLPVHSAAGRLLRLRDRIRIEPAAVSIDREVMGVRTAKKLVALSEFSGVAIRAALVGENEDRFAISVNLHHEDPALCVPLHMAFDTDEANARWQSWARALRLPLLMPAPEGGWREPVQRLGKITVNPPCRRDPRRMLAARRSAMSSIRDTGVAREAPVVSGVEIVARN
jgi:hypothetical protein